MSWLINAAQLDKFRKSQKSVVVLDASWHAAAEGRDAKQEFVANHIIGARFFDFAALNDTATSLPNMLTRDTQRISEEVGALGITNEHKIIFYDRSPHHSCCRALWMFKVFGHNPTQLYVLDGGFDAWEKYGGKMEAGDTRSATKKPYTVNFAAHHIRTLMQMKSNLNHPAEQVIDVRHPIRYAGGKEPREGLRQGHIPGSFSFPFMTMFESDGRFKPIEKIRKQLLSIGVSLNVPIISTCGSGMTAAILNFALDLIDPSNPQSLYDGSFTEWGAETLYAGETSLAERPVETSLEK